MDNKIKEKFYPLTSEMVRKLRESNLTVTEWKLWSYLITLNPFGDRYQELPPLVEVLTEVGISKASFYRAIAHLQELNLFDFQADIKFRSLSRAKKVSVLRQKSQPCEKSLSPETKISAVRKKSQSCENRSPEPSIDKACSAPHTIQTYSDLIKTLSEGERENFLNFSLEKCKSLPKLPQLPLKWIEAHWQELYAQFKSTPEAAAAAIANTDWTQHSDWEEWLQEMREGVPRFVALGTCFNRKMRRAIADWADERGLIWGTES